MKDVRLIARKQDMTSDWLRSALLAGGAASTVRVGNIQIEQYRTKPYSTLYKVRADIDGDEHLPERFLVKVARPDVTNTTSRRRRRKEHAFYTTLAPQMQPSVAPAIFAALCSEDASHAFLLMEDLSGSHDRPPRGLPPAPEQARGAMDVFAALHAAWWNHPDLEVAVAMRDAAYIAERSESSRDSAADLLSNYGQYLDLGMRHAIERSAENTARLMGIAFTGSISAIHGDAHPWNLLSPRTQEGKPVLLDWEAWSVDSPALDIVSYIVLRFDPGLRRRLEPELLARYHAALVHGGVSDYDLTQFHDDYRRALVRRAMMPVGRARRGEEPDGWWNTLSRVALAWEDHDCDRVLQ